MTVLQLRIACALHRRSLEHAILDRIIVLASLKQDGLTPESDCSLAADLKAHALVAANLAIAAGFDRSGRCVEMLAQLQVPAYPL